MSAEKIEKQAIQELRNMARIYERRGDIEQARKMLQLALQIENRIEHKAAASVAEQRVVNE